MAVVYILLHASPYNLLLLRAVVLFFTQPSFIPLPDVFQMDSQIKLELNGSLRKHNCPELFAEISQAKFSGSLRLSKKKEKVIVYFEAGEVVFAVSNLRIHRLFEILLNENVVSEKKLLGIDGFANDLHLAGVLVEEGILSTPIVDSIFSIQLKRIINAVLEWNDGEWMFSPTAKLKEGIRQKFDLKQLLRKYADSLPDEYIVSRFRSVAEGFTLVSKDFDVSSLQSSQEAFVVSRFGTEMLSIEEIRTMSGIPSKELTGMLYRMWFGGIINRENWNPIIKDKDVKRINEAKLTLITSAGSLAEDQETAIKEDEEAQRLAAEAEETRLREEKAVKAKTISLEAYLKQVKEAATHYEIFGVSPDSKISEVKQIYFRFAKNFHPDLFYRKVEDKKHREIQNAFTEIARAYDTIRDKDSRELYDFKLRKVIEASKSSDRPPDDAKTDFETHKEAQAAVPEFERGYALFMDGYYGKSLPFLERAVKLDDENPRYHAYLGKALSHDSKNRHRAESELQKAVKLDGDNPVYHMMLAELYFEIGLTARAKGELNRILEIIPDDSEALALLDRIS